MNENSSRPTFLSIFIYFYLFIYIFKRTQPLASARALPSHAPTPCYRGHRGVEGVKEFRSESSGSAARSAVSLGLTARVWIFPAAPPPFVE
jgi:hypothetical protein